MFFLLQWAQFPNAHSPCGKPPSLPPCNLGPPAGWHGLTLCSGNHRSFLFHLSDLTDDMTWNDMTWHDMMYLMYFRETGAHQDGWQKIVSWLTDSVTDITKTWDAIASKKWNRYCCLAVLCLCQWKIQLTHKLHIFNFTIGNVHLVLPLFSISQKYQKSQNGTSFAQQFDGKLFSRIFHQNSTKQAFSHLSNTTKAWKGIRSEGSNHSGFCEYHKNCPYYDQLFMLWTIYEQFWIYGQLFIDYEQLFHVWSIDHMINWPYEQSDCSYMVSCS